MRIRSPKPSLSGRGRWGALFLTALLAGFLFPLSAGAQTPSQPPPPRGKPPAEAAPGPSGSDSPKDESLSDRLQRDGGVIRPPGNIAPDNTIVPNDPGRMRVIPPPGSPQGDPQVQPK